MLAADAEVKAIAKAKEKSNTNDLIDRKHATNGRSVCLPGIQDHEFREWTR